MGSLTEHDFRGRAGPLVFWIFVCCCCAVTTNVSTYELLRLAPPVTYQVISQLKTCAIVALGYIFFDVATPFAWLVLRFSGVAVASIGVVAYNVQKMHEKEAKAKAKAS